MLCILINWLLCYLMSIVLTPDHDTIHVFENNGQEIIWRHT